MPKIGAALEKFLKEYGPVAGGAATVGGAIALTPEEADAITARQLEAVGTRGIRTVEQLGQPLQVSNKAGRKFFLFDANGNFVPYVPEFGNEVYKYKRVPQLGVDTTKGLRWAKKKWGERGMMELPEAGPQGKTVSIPNPGARTTGEFTVNRGALTDVTGTKNALVPKGMEPIEGGMNVGVSNRRSYISIPQDDDTLFTILANPNGVEHEISHMFQWLAGQRSQNWTDRLEESIALLSKEMQPKVRARYTNDELPGITAKYFSEAFTEGKKPSRDILAWAEANASAARENPQMLSEIQAEAMKWYMRRLPKEQGGMGMSVEEARTAGDQHFGTLMTYGLHHVKQFPDSDLAYFWLTRKGERGLRDMLIQQGTTPADATKAMQAAKVASLMKKRVPEGEVVGTWTDRNAMNVLKHQERAAQVARGRERARGLGQRVVGAAGTAGPAGVLSLIAGMPAENAAAQAASEAAGAEGVINLSPEEMGQIEQQNVAAQEQALQEGTGVIQLDEAEDPFKQTVNLGVNQPAQPPLAGVKPYGYAEPQTFEEAKLAQRTPMQVAIDKVKEGATKAGTGLGNIASDVNLGGPQAIKGEDVVNAGMGALEMLDPAFTQLGNVARTGVGLIPNAVQAAVPGALPEVPSAASNLRNIFEQAPENRPSTGNEGVDIVADLAAGFAPIKAPGWLKQGLQAMKRSEFMKRYGKPLMLPEGRMNLPLSSRGVKRGWGGAEPTTEQADILANWPKPNAPLQIERGSIPMGGATEPFPTQVYAPAEEVLKEGKPGLIPVERPAPFAPPTRDSQIAYTAEGKPAWMARPDESDTVAGAVQAKEGMPDVRLTDEEALGATADAEMRRNVLNQDPNLQPGRAAQGRDKRGRFGKRGGKDETAKPEVQFTGEMGEAQNTSSVPGQLMLTREEAMKKAQSLRQQLNDPAFDMSKARSDRARQRILADRRAIDKQIELLENFRNPSADEAKGVMKIMDPRDMPRGIPTALAAIIRPLDQVLEKSAPEAVTKVRQAFHNGNKYEHYFLSTKDQILKGISPDEHATVINVLKTGTPSGNAKIDAAADRLRNEIFEPIIRMTADPKLRSRIGNVGYLENYFPEMRGKEIEEFLPFQNAVKPGDVISEAELLALKAAGYVNPQYVRDPATRNMITNFFKKRQGPVDKPVLDLEKILNAYIAGTRKSIFDLPAVIDAKDMVALMPKYRQTRSGKKVESDIHNLANEYLDYYVGAPSSKKGFKPTKAMETWLTNRVYQSLLGLNLRTAAINPTQLANTAATEGIGRTLATAVKTPFSKRRQKEFVEAGQRLDFPGLEQGALSQETKGQKAFNEIIMAPFSFTEGNVNRASTWHAYMERMAANDAKITALTTDLRMAMKDNDYAKAAQLQRKLTKLYEETPHHNPMGPTTPSEVRLENFQLTPREQKAAELVGETQFTYGRLSPFKETVEGSGLPARLMTQMTSYPRRQLNFATRLMQKAVKDGDWAPLIRWTALQVPIAAASANYLGNFMPGKSPAVKLASDLEEVRRGRKKPEEWLADAALLLIPGGLQAKKVYKSVKSGDVSKIF